MDLPINRSDDEDGELFAVPEYISTVGDYVWTVPLDPCNHGLSSITLNMRAMIRLNKEMLVNNAEQRNMVLQEEHVEKTKSRKKKSRRVSSYCDACAVSPRRTGPTPICR